MIVHVLTLAVSLDSEPRVGDPYIKVKVSKCQYILLLSFFLLSPFGRALASTSPTLALALASLGKQLSPYFQEESLEEHRIWLETQLFLFQRERERRKRAGEASFLGFDFTRFLEAVPPYFYRQTNRTCPNLVDFFERVVREAFARALPKESCPQHMVQNHEGQVYGLSTKPIDLPIAFLLLSSIQISLVVVMDHNSNASS